jgi:enoyl-CoA hydratase/carnithine racemase
MGACAMLPRIIGLGRAAELLYTGRSMSGTQAYEWGFYNELCAPHELLGRSTELARTIARGPTLAHAMTKRMLKYEWALPLDEAIDAEAWAQATCMESNDFRRAYEAFMAKRTPRFEGN